MSDGRDMPRWRDDEMRAFLLGALSADRTASLEEEIFEHDAAHDALLDARYDLLDDYARGALSPLEREQVERRLLGDASDAALGLAELLASRPPALAPPAPSAAPVARGAAPRRRDLRLLAAAAMAVIAIGASIRLALDNRRLEADLARATARPPVTAPPPATDDGGQARLVLSPQTTRSDAAPPELTIPAAAAVVEVVVPVDEVAPEYRAALEGRDGVLWTGRRLTRAADGTLHLWLAATMLQDGSYELLVYGGPSADAPLVAAFPFRIRR